MNLLRGVLSIGIIIACLLNWVDIEAEGMMFSLTGLKWVPTTILLYASVVTAGYAFYNSYSSTNQNAWIYLTCGLYGVGVTGYIYLTVIQNVKIIYELVPAKHTDSVAFDFGIGIYLAGLLSFLLLLSGFDKSGNREQGTQQKFDQQYNPLGQQSNAQSNGQKEIDKPSLKDWMKENPGKSINDYFSKFK